MRLPDAAVDHVLARWPVARLATVDAGGRPHLVPLVFARAANRLWSPVDGKPKAHGEPARVRNLRHRPECALLLDQYDESWEALWWVRVDAVGIVVDDPAMNDATAAVAALRAKYPQYATVPVLRDPPTLLAFEVRRIRSWAASPAAVPSGGLPNPR